MNAPDIRRPGYMPTRIMPQSYQDVEDIAKKAVKAGLFRYAEGTPIDVAEAQCVFAIMGGMDAGMTPAQAVRDIYVKDGKCNIAGQGVLALIWGAGFNVAEVQATEANDWTASCTITRSDGTQITRSFSKADAIRAGLWKEEPSMASTWWTFQARMLKWRAVGFAASDGASDVLRGLHILENTDIDAKARAERPQPSQSSQPAQTKVLDVPDDIDQDRAFLDGMVDGVNRGQSGGQSGDQSWNSAQHMADLKAALAVVPTTTDLATIWDSHLEASDGKLSRAWADDAESWYKAASDRLG